MITFRIAGVVGTFCNPDELTAKQNKNKQALYQAGQRLGVDAANLLEQIPDDDLRLFASIELAAAMAGVPGPRIIQMKQPNPPHSAISGAAG